VLTARTYNRRAVQRVLSTVTLLGLLVATAAAFAITEHFKLIRTPVFDAHVSKRLSPVCGCAESKATITLQLRHRDRVTLTIQDSRGDTVATLASGRPEPKAQVLTFPWNGKTDSGSVAPDGVYRPQIHLADARWTILFPNRIVLDTTPPKVRSASVQHRVLLAGGSHAVAIHYVLGERAHAAVYLGGNRLIRSRRRESRGVLKWKGRGAGGKSLPARRYVLSVGAIDLAGNATPPAGQKEVVVRLVYIEVTPHVARVRAGARFSLRVETAAQQYGWRFAGQHGTAEGSVLRLRAPAKKGTYRLVVTEDGHKAVAIVKARK